MKKFLLTKEGKEKLEAEYQNYVEVLRPNVIRELSEARAQGDLSENADYDAARDEQSRIAGRISVIENILKNYELIDEEANNLGKWVKVEFIGLEDEDDDPVQIYKIVGTLEADPLQQLISNESPLGSAIVNHGVGEQVYVKPEEGEEFWAKILEISSEEIK